ncbi:CLUMA_CG008475, isoform B [Clunio marinus]|uniref:Mannosyltransferase n=1 Tax=Clunio marinus TaxID=568069 RepID=A0A1J1I468_9DIPT|nr:CLUMA_CG008475, isoform B [Clunio marinus]
MKNINKYTKIKNFSLLTYYALVVIRIVLVFIPQYGYIHPDEFFQTSEVISGETFQLEATRTWEFNTTMPIRSYAIPFFYLRIPMAIFRIFSTFSRIILNFDLLSSYTLLVFPRVIMCILSFVNDFSVFKICSLYNLKYDIRLMALASSGVMLTFGIRSFSNSVEMLLCSLLLYFVSDSMILSNTVIYQKEYLEEKYEKAKKVGERVKYFKMKMSLPQHSYNNFAILSTICIVGIFNRPTFMLFGFPTIFHWMIRGFGTRSVTFFDFNIRMLLFIISGLPTLFVIIIIDSLYYGYLSLAQIYIMDVKIESFLVTPVNFFRYNLIPENTAKHGEHPKWLHMLINIPLLYNVLGIIAVFTFGSMFYKFCKKEFNNLPHSQSFVSLMTSAVFAPVLLLSLFNHQEPRFIIPITVPLIMLHAPKLITGINVTSFLKESKWNVAKFLSNYIDITISGKIILRLWFLANVMFTLFFGFIHQAGVVQLADYFSKYHQMQPSSKQIHLVTSHIYKLPESLLILPHASSLYTNPQTGQTYKMKRRFFIHEYGGLKMEEMFKKTKLLSDVAENRMTTKNINYDLFVAVPTSKAFELNQIFHKHRGIFSFKEERIFYPHLSTEAFPNIHQVFHPCEIDIVDENEFDEQCVEDEVLLSSAVWTRKFTSIAQQFGLVVYKIEVKHKSF